MKQLSFFDDCIPSSVIVKKGAISWKLFVDGASRKNPGLAGAGIFLLKEEELIYKKGFFLGVKTNNQAEYLALLLGIYFAKKHINANDVLYIFSDSELLIKHMKGEYKIRSLELKQLFNCAHLFLSNINYSFCHILREYNGIADALANEGIDKRTPMPGEFQKIMHQYEISL